MDLMAAKDRAAVTRVEKLQAALALPDVAPVLGWRIFRAGQPCGSRTGLTASVEPAMILPGWKGVSS
jgi:hypothetical protein